MLETFDDDKDALSQRGVLRMAANATVWSLHIVPVDIAHVGGNKGKL